jgi:hypothetical protein
LIIGITLVKSAAAGVAENRQTKKPAEAGFLSAHAIARAAKLS